MISHPKSRRNEIVGTTNISIAAIPSAWLRRNVLQPWDGGSRRLTMYLATLVCPISTPSLRSSPWIRGAPHSGLAMLISRISLRISNGTVGLPHRALDFHRQYKRKPARCHLTTVSGFTIASASRTPGRSRSRQTKINRSTELRACFLGAVRRRMFICCRNVRISAWSAARDRNRSTTIQTMSLTRSLIPQQDRPILDQLLVRLSLRQGQPPEGTFTVG